MQRWRLPRNIKMILSQPNKVIRAVGVDASDRSRVNVMTCLGQLIENATHLKDVVENDTVSHQMIVLDAPRGSLDPAIFSRHRKDGSSFAQRSDDFE